MKRLILLLVAIAFFAGCAAAERSEFFLHDTMYRDGGHLWYSWHKYKTTDQDDMKKSQERNWWGETIEGDQGQVASK